jgi:hypothetical protein
MTKDLLINPLVYYAALHNAQKPHAALCGFAHPVYYPSPPASDATSVTSLCGKTKR